MIMNMKSLSGHPKNWLLENKGFKEKPGGKVRPSPREDCEEDHFLKNGVFKNDT